MNDKELLAKVEQILWFNPQDMFGDNWDTDWRLAGACLKAWPTTINVEHLDMTLDQMLRDPRAIIEAFVESSND